MTRYEIPLLVSSDPSQGAENLVDNGSTFEISLNYPLDIPERAKNCYIVCPETTIWWSIPNIETGVNDDFTITYTAAGGSPIIFSIQIPQGLYNITNLDSTIKRLLVNEGAPPDIITLSGDNSTQKSVIKVVIDTFDSLSIDFTPSNSVASILGFNPAVIGPYSGTENVFSDNIAKFNTLDYLLIKSDIVSTGLRVNNQYSGIINHITIDVPPGSQIINRPFHPPKIPCNELVGNKIKTLRFYLTDQNGAPVNTNGEYWSVRFYIEYTL